MNNGTFDGFLLYPQTAAPSGGWSQSQIDAMADLITKYLVPQVKVDINRIIVNGLSGGGDATWLFAESHPTLPAAVIPMSAANIADEQYVPSLKFTPIWLFQGGLDKSPDPSTTIQLVNTYLNAAGGNLTYTLFPTDGHDTWDDTWKQADYFPFMLRAYKANPWTLTGKTQFCPTDVINATLGVTAGFNGYQWRKNGTVLSGASSNTLAVNAVGTYDCSILRGSVWSPFSPTPVVISIKAPTISPNIQVNGLISDVVPAPDGAASVSLQVPTGFVSYTWERVDSPVNNPAILASTTNVLNGATPGKYAVKVTEQFGCSSSFSNSFSVVNTNGPNAPSVPTNLLATAISKTQIKLTWSENPAPPNPETQFEIYQGTSQSGSFKLIGFAPALTDSFVVSSLSPKTTLFYEVRAINNTAGSAVAGPSSAITQSDITAPSAPGNLRSGIKNETSVQLIWDPSTDDVGVTAYDIYVNGNKAYTVGNVTTFTAYNLINGSAYTFAVKARDFAGNVSPFSNQLAAVAAFSGLDYNYYTGTWTTLPDFNTLTPVTSGGLPNISLSSATSTTSFGFTFTGFIVIPATGSYTFETTSSDGSKLYIDIPYSAAATATVSNDAVHGTRTVASKVLTLTAGTHTFAVTYFKGATTGANLTVSWKTPLSANKFVTIPNTAFVQSVTTGATPTAPSLVAATTVSAKRISLSWQDNSNNETGFQVFRSTSAAGSFITIATVKPNVTTFLDSLLSASTTYFYQLQAINQAGSSAFSTPVASATTQALPPVAAAPTGLSGTAQGPTHVALSWTDADINATGFQVWRSPVTNSNYLLTATLPLVTSYTDSGLTANSLYFYKVTATNEAGSSAYSNEISVTTTPIPATTVTLTPIANQNLLNDSTYSLALTATSSAGVGVSFTSSNLPVFGSLTDNGNGTATLSFHPTSSQLGIYNAVVITATDNFGGTTSNTFNITVSGRNQTTVLVNFNSSGPAGAPWNSMNANPTTGAAITGMKDSHGNTTTDGITITNNWEGAMNTGMTTGNNSGVVPDAVMQNFYFGSTFNPYTFNITGLNPAKKYALVFFAGYPWSAAMAASTGTLVATYTVGTQTVSLDAANNTTNTTTLGAISPNASGVISVSVSKPAGGAYCLISALEIEGYDVPTGVVLTPPSALIANGFSVNSIHLNWTGSSDTRTGFEVWRSTSPVGTFSLLNTVGANVTAYTDSSLPANSTYFYEVREAVSGGQFSAYSNIAGGSTVAFTVNLSLNSVSTFAQRAPWNDVNTLVSDGFTLPNMMDMNFQTTGINFNVIRNFQGFNGAVGITTGHNTGVVPDTVMSSFYYTEFGDSAVLSINGLSRTTIYNIGFFGGTTYNALTNTVYQIGNQTTSINALGNTTTIAYIYGIKPDSTGTINMTMHSTVGYGFLNSITIQGMPSADVIGADSTGMAGTIAASLVNRNGLTGLGASILDPTVAATPEASATGLNLNTSLGAYPNPFVDNVTVSFDVKQNVGKFAVVIVDAGGRIVRKEEFTNVPGGRWQQTMNLSGLPRGMYFVQVLGSEAVQSFKMVKVR